MLIEFVLPVFIFIVIVIVIIELIKEIYESKDR